MKISDVYPRKYASAEDLKGDLAVIIENVVMEDMFNRHTMEMETKPVVYFKNAGKGMVLNKKNAGVIVDAYGDDTDAWKGKAVVLFPKQEMYKGELTDCLRVKPPITVPTSAKK